MGIFNFFKQTTDTDMELLDPNSNNNETDKIEETEVEIDEEETKITEEEKEEETFSQEDYNEVYGCATVIIDAAMDEDMPVSEKYENINNTYKAFPKELRRGAFVEITGYIYGRYYEMSEEVRERYSLVLNTMKGFEYEAVVNETFGKNYFLPDSFNRQLYKNKMPEKYEDILKEFIESFKIIWNEDKTPEDIEFYCGSLIERNEKTEVILRNEPVLKKMYLNYGNDFVYENILDTLHANGVDKELLESGYIYRIQFIIQKLFLATLYQAIFTNTMLNVKPFRKLIEYSGIPVLTRVIFHELYYSTMYETLIDWSEINRNVIQIPKEQAAIVAKVIRITYIRLMSQLIIRIVTDFIQNKPDLYKLDDDSIQKINKELHNSISRLLKEISNPKECDFEFPELKKKVFKIIINTDKMIDTLVA